MAKELQNLQKNSKLLGVFLQAMQEDHLSRADFTEAFEQLVKKMKEIKAEFEANVSGKKDEMSAEFETSLTAMNQTIAEMQKAVADTKESSRSDARLTMKMFNEKMQEFQNLIPDAFDDSELRSEIDGIIARFDDLKIPDEFDATNLVEAIEELYELYDDLEEKIKKAGKSGGGWGGSRIAHIPLVDDFSTSTDGATKSFTLSKEPRSLTTAKVWGSDFPYILRYNTDFTIAGKTLTLTDEVDAPTSGATLICEYYV